MAETLRFQIIGDLNLMRKLADFAETIGDYRPVWKTINTDFEKIEKGQFDSEGARGGAKWAPLSPAYAAMKRKQFPARKIMVRTGALKGSLIQSTSNSHKVISKTRFERGTRVGYAKFHQPDKKGRKVIDLTAQDNTRWVKFIQEFVVKGLRKFKK